MAYLLRYHQVVCMFAKKRSIPRLSQVYFYLFGITCFVHHTIGVFNIYPYLVYTVPCECNNNMFNVNNYYPSSSSLSIRTSKNKCVLTAMKLNLYKIAFLPHNNCNVSDPYFHYLEFRTTKKELKLKMKITSLFNIPVAINRYGMY